jgi:hypothetical protein
VTDLVKSVFLCFLRQNQRENIKFKQITMPTQRHNRTCLPFFSLSLTLFLFMCSFLLPFLPFNTTVSVREIVTKLFWDTTYTVCDRKHFRSYCVNFISYYLLELWDVNRKLGVDDGFLVPPQEEVEGVISEAAQLCCCVGSAIC